MRFGLGLIADGMRYRELGCGLRIQRILFGCEFTRALWQNTPVNIDFNGSAEEDRVWRRRRTRTGRRSPAPIRDFYSTSRFRLRTKFRISLFQRHSIHRRRFLFGSLQSRVAHRRRWRQRLASVEVPPDGYRRNVGICLINRSNHVWLVVNSVVAVEIWKLWFEFDWWWCLTCDGVDFCCIEVEVEHS